MKSFSRLVNRPTDTNLRLVITEEDNITNDLRLYLLLGVELWIQN